MLDISNYYEQLVIDHLWKLTQDHQSEDKEPLTQAFIEDVACLALNKLPVCYVRNLVDKGANLTELNYEEMSALVSEAIASAVNQVKLRPHDTRD